MSDPISVASVLCQAMAEQGKDVKAQVNHQDNFGQTPLHRAALRGSTICALNLIQVDKKIVIFFKKIYHLEIPDLFIKSEDLTLGRKAKLYPHHGTGGGGEGEGCWYSLGFRCVTIF